MFECVGHSFSRSSAERTPQCHTHASARVKGVVVVQCAHAAEAEKRKSICVYVYVCIICIIYHIFVRPSRRAQSVARNALTDKPKQPTPRSFFQLARSALAFHSISQTRPDGLHTLNNVASHLNSARALFCPSVHVLRSSCLEQLPAVSSPTYLYKPP